MTGRDLLWPGEECLDDHEIGGFLRHLRDTHALDLADYPALWAWSTQEPEAFWSAVRDHFRIGVGDDSTALTSRLMPGAEWFPGVHLNFAEYALLQGNPDDTALIVADESGVQVEYTRARLRNDVRRLAGWLRDLGVGPGDVVAGYLPNSSEAVIAFLATASLGAIWTSVGQDYAASAVITRMSQLAPVVLVSADGYVFNGKRHSRVAAIREITADIESITHVVVSRRLGDEPLDDDWVTWDDALAGTSVAEPASMPFGHPLWALFSSGTTGTPKALVHSHGGVALAMATMLRLQMDIRHGDRLFWYTSPSWMMWNVLVAALSAGAAAVCYDGAADPATVWSVVESTGATFFGTSPGFLRATRDAGITPADDYELSLRAMGSTGSPLPAELHRWTRDAIGVRLHSSSGGTDVVAAFLGGAPGVPIWAGELSAPALGVAVQAWAPDGTPVAPGEVGELVVTRPMPSMPVFLWGDADGTRYRGAYFDVFPGVWRHGDWVTFTEDHSAVLHGRSDATLNRNGVRMGSGDIYAAVEALPEVAEALVVGVEDTDGGYWMPMFVTLAPDRILDAHIIDKIRDTVRRDVSPRHVPDEVIEVAGIPHTRTGKKLEIPVKRILQGATPSSVAALDAVDQPEFLTAFESFRRPTPSRVG